MEYFTRQITLQDRLKQHECQLYPLIGSCLELRDNSPEGCFQDSPLDLSHGGLVSTDRPPSLQTGRIKPTGRSSSPETGGLNTTDRPLSLETGRLVPIDTSSSQGNNEPPTTGKSSPSGIQTSIQTQKKLPSENQDLLLLNTSVISNSEGGTSCVNDQPERQSKHEQDTIQLTAHREEITDVTNPLLKRVLESEESTVSAIFTMKDTQDPNEMLHHVKHMHESDASLQRDHEDKQSNSSMKSDRERVSKQRHSSIIDDHQSKHSDTANGLEHNSVVTNGQEHKLHSSTTTDGRESEQSDSTMTDNKLPKPTKIAAKGVTNSNETILKHAYSRKRGRYFSTGVMQAYLPNGKKLCGSKICPNVNVTDFTHQCLNDKNRHVSENATNCRQMWPKSDLNVLIPWAGENHHQVSSRGHHSNQMVMLVPSSVSLIGNTSSVEQTAERPLVVDNSPKQCVPPPLLSLTNSRSELRRNQNMYYPCSQSNSMTQQYPQNHHHHQQQHHHQMKHSIHTPSAAITNKNSFRLTAPFDLSTKIMHSKKQASHAYNSVSEETRIKDISDNLRAQLLGQSATVPHSCPGICLGHAIKGKTASKFKSSTPHKMSFLNTDIDQTSMIIERQVLLNLDDKHLLNIDSKTLPKVDKEVSSSESQTTGTDRLPKQDDQQLLSVEQQITQSVGPKATQNIDHKRSPDGNQVTAQAVVLQRSPVVSHNMSTDIDRNMLLWKEQSPSAVAQEREQIDASASTHMDTNGSNDRTARSTAWNMSVSKTIGLHSDCNNCKACRRIFAKLSIPPIEERPVSSK